MAYKFIGEEALEMLVEFAKNGLNTKIGKDDLSNLTDAELQEFFLGFDSSLFGGVLDQYYTSQQVNDMIAALTSGSGEIQEITVSEMNQMWGSK